MIDEEQRFGVKHKEALKELKKGGCAYLDSTPYTSNSSHVYARIRDLSVIETPRPIGILCKLLY